MEKQRRGLDRYKCVSIFAIVGVVELHLHVRRSRFSGLRYISFVIYLFVVSFIFILYKMQS